jgi:hypothetical protein
MSQEFKKRMDAMAPHTGRHSVFGCQSSQCRASGWVLAGKEEVMMLMQQSSVQSDQGLPLVVIELRLGVGGLCIVDLYAFCFNHNKAGVYTFDFRD